MTNPCGNCVGGVKDGAICPFCNGTTFISTNSQGMDELPTTPEAATADTSVTAAAPADAGQTTETQSVPADAGVQAAPESSDTTPTTAEVNG